MKNWRSGKTPSPGSLTRSDLSRQAERGDGLTLAALGGPYTFNGQAALAMLERYPKFGSVIYYPTSEAVVEAALRGEVDASCAPEQTSQAGFHPGMLARMAAPGSKLHVIAEIARRYDCSLLGKPGSQLSRIRRVFGHDGSIAHSRKWLESHLPAAEITIVTTHSEVAARTVLEGDGSIASVGSPPLAARFGLVELANAIDDGSSVNYWAVSLRPDFSDTPNRVLVTGRFGNDTQLGELISALAGAGYLLRSIAPLATGRALYEYDYVMRFAGTGRFEAARAAVAGLASARLAGAWEIPGDRS